MGLLPRFWNLPQLLAVRISIPVPVRPSERRRPSSIKKRFLMLWGAILALALTGSGESSIAFGPPGEKPRTIVAAGFGYQIGGTSTITVKTYDPLTGEVLSDETYELNVTEEGATAAPQPNERIFAGGVGAGTTGLSNFTIRVYEASSGKFLWEGTLNLTPRVSDDASRVQLVVERRVRQATVVPVADHERSASEPSFLLRAVNPETGGLVWEDQFSTDSGAVRWERIAYRAAGQGESSTRMPHEFDFRIRMWDRDGRRLLWEDAISGIDPVDPDPMEEVDGHAEFLPPWPSPERQSLQPELIRYRGQGQVGDRFGSGKAAL